MDFTATKGQEFKESFDFKNGQGKAISLPLGAFKVVLEHGPYAKEFTTQNQGLLSQRSAVVWTISADDTNDFAYNILYYTLYLDDQELSRGIVRVQ